MRLFLLQIVDANEPHAVVRIPYGGSIEKDLIAHCTQAIVNHGVGFFKTEAQVKDAISQGLTEAIATLKQDTRFVTR